MCDVSESVGGGSECSGLRKESEDSKVKYII